jgi:hypothetical protein
MVATTFARHLSREHQRRERNRSLPRAVHPDRIWSSRARTQALAPTYDHGVSIRDRVARNVDVLVVVLIGTLYVAEVLFSGELTRGRSAGTAVAVFFASSFLARRTLPLVPLLAAVAVVEINHTVLHGIAEGGSFMLGLVIALYSGTRYARGWMLPACVAVSVAIIPLAAFDPQQPPTVGDWVFFTTFIGFPIVAGRIFFRRHETDERIAT